VENSLAAQFAGRAGGRPARCRGGGNGPANAQAPAAARRPAARPAGRAECRVRVPSTRLEVLQGGCARRGTAGFADANWKDVDLPHDFSIEGLQRECAGGRSGWLPTVSAGTANASVFPSLTTAESYRSSSTAFISFSEVWHQRSAPPATAVRVHRLLLRP